MKNNLLLPLVAIICVAQFCGAEGTTNSVCTMAERAIVFHKEGQVQQGKVAFERFAEMWNETEKTIAFDKYVYIKAGECFFGVWHQ